MGRGREGGDEGGREVGEERREGGREGRMTVQPSLPTHTLAPFILFQIQEVVHSSLVIIHRHTILHVLVLSHLKKLLYLLRERVLREELI